MENKIKFYRFDNSTNAERVALVLAHKKLAVESIQIDPKDRSIVKKVSGQTLVPVIQDGEKVIFDSPVIIQYLDQKYPENPLYPKENNKRVEMEIFIDWFNKAWKKPPNEITDEYDKVSPDHGKIDRLGNTMKMYTKWFEEILTGKEYLFGTFSAADCIAFPFLKYAHLGLPKGDNELFHQVLVKYQPLGNVCPNIKRWIELMEKRPRA